MICFFFTKHVAGDEIRGMRWVGHVACMGERRGAYRDLVGSSEGKKPL